MGTTVRRQPSPGARRGRRKLAVLALGAVGLAAALTFAALLSPDRAVAAAPTYVPAEPGQVVATVPPRDPSEVAARQALAAAPDRVELAVELARTDIERYRRLSDPRYLGRAQATLGRWWKLAEPPPDVLLLRATIEQAIHRFAEARADLDRLIQRRPDDPQAQLTRAVVATVTADYAAARDSCRALAALAGPIVVATCEAPLDAIAGQADEAYARLARLVGAARSGDAPVRGWALTELAELAYMRGDTDAAAGHLAGALALDPDDAYARNLLADILLATHRPADASRLLAGREQIDSHLVRRAIAEHDRHGPDAARLVAAMRDRIAAAAERGDRIHLREEARFALAVDLDAARAVRTARDNWGVQKELADARLLAEAAVAAGDRDAAQPVIAWARATGVRDATLDGWLGRLGGGAMRTALAAIALCVAWGAAAPAWAHKPSDAHLRLAVDGDAITGRLDVAVRDLDAALELDADGNGEITWRELSDGAPRIADYVTRRLTLGADGAPCALRLGAPALAELSDGAYWATPVAATCSHPPRSLDVGYALLFDLDSLHRGLLHVAGQTAILRDAQPARIALDQATAVHSFIVEGVWHIWMGIDHILFLVCLILPAVFQRRTQRWTAADSLRDVCKEVFEIVTAFTLAHSITLVISAVGLVALPSRLIETAIALSVVAAALNNLLRTFDARWAVAFSLGLLHGFGFSSVLIDLGLPSHELIGALLGFNLGVELGQAAIVVALLPALYWIRRTVAYQALLWAGSAGVALVATLWSYQRWIA